MGYYWTYYALTLFAAYAVHNPWVCGVVVLLVVARPWLPDPVILGRTLSRIGTLKTQVGLNAANITARRDLGRAYLDLRWGGRALRYLDEARALDPKDGEIAYLRGLALLRIGKDEEALRALGEAVGIDPSSGEPFSDEPGRKPGNSFTRYSEAYLAAAQALENLGRLEQAEDALAMSARLNTSLIEPLVRLARVKRRRGDAQGARATWHQARKTFGELPGFMRRRQLGWGLRAYLAA
jgi:tetratricopeptide (TPR) repeat protein